MQKALQQMNLHLPHVVSDLDGETGLRILDAILAGERDPEKLVQLRDRQCRKSTPEQMVAALQGDFLVAGSLSRQQDQRRQSAQQPHGACGQPRGHPAQDNGPGRGEEQTPGGEVFIGPCGRAWGRRAPTQPPLTS